MNVKNTPDLDGQNCPAKFTDTGAKKGAMYGKAHAIVVLPWCWVRARSTLTPQNRRWLARAPLEPGAAKEPLLQVLDALGLSPPAQGVGALRLWGQTGRRPDGWVAAADPVFLEARLDDLALHPLAVVQEAELSEIVELLGRVLPEDDLEFVSVRELAYIVSKQTSPTPSVAPSSSALATANASPVSAQGVPLQNFLPTGEGAAEHDRLQSEMQMCLFDADVNERRAQNGELPVSTLWLWGGGIAPVCDDESDAALPALYADDPLCRGYWSSKAGTGVDWPGSLAACLAAAPAGFVAVLPRNRQSVQEAGINEELTVLRGMLRRGVLRSMSILFADGSRVDRHRWDPIRFWRRKGPSPAKDAR